MITETSVKKKMKMRAFTFPCLKVNKNKHQCLNKVSEKRSRYKKQKCFVVVQELVGDNGLGTIGSMKE